jgi:hypothetical protein
MPRALAKRNSTTNGLTQINLASGAMVENLKKLEEIDGEGRGKLERVLESQWKLEDRQMAMGVETFQTRALAIEPRITSRR